MDKFLDTLALTLKAMSDRLSARIEALEQRAAVPGRDGRDGVPGVMGERGPEGPQGLEGKAGPIGALGPMGPEGPAGPPGPAGRDGKDGRDGIDGKDGAMGPQGEKGLDGANGRDGRDGIDFSIKDIVGHDFDGRRLTLKFERDGARYDAALVLSGVPAYRDVWEAKHYEAGDVVTYGGGLWIAKADTDERPGSGATAWRLCVKAGRDGKQGPQGPQGPLGPRGEKGDRGPDRW